MIDFAALANLENKHLAMKKIPKQTRSKTTVQAIVETGALLLEKKGYAELTTNDIADRAGVSIGSIYEYFPGKDAIITAVASVLASSILSKMESELILAEEMALDSALRQWINSLYRLSREKHKIIGILLFQVPFIHEIPAIVSMRQQFFRIALLGASKTKNTFHINFSRESVYLITTMTGSTLLHLAIMPPTGLDVETIIDELCNKVIKWFEHQPKERGFTLSP